MCSPPGLFDELENWNLTSRFAWGMFHRVRRERIYPFRNLRLSPQFVEWYYGTNRTSRQSPRLRKLRRPPLHKGVMVHCKPKRCTVQCTTGSPNLGGGGQPGALRCYPVLYRSTGVPKNQNPAALRFGGPWWVMNLSECMNAFPTKIPTFFYSTNRSKTAIGRNG